MLNVDVFVEDPAWMRLHEDWEGYVGHLVQSTLLKAHLEPMLNKQHGVEVSVQLTNDLQQKALNSHYRGKNQPTNVLSFPLVSRAEIDQFNLGLIGANEPDLLLGDIILAYETIMREAEEQNKHPLHHSAHMLVHGCLHLLGYDHEAVEEAEVMEALEQEILSGFGITNPYAQD